MVTVRKSIVITAPVEKIFSYMADPQSNMEWLPGIMEVKDVRETPDRVGTTFRWVYKMAGMKFEGETTLLEYVPNLKMVTEGKGGISSRWHFDYAPVPEGTRLDVAVEYTVPLPVLGKIAEAAVRLLNEREVDLALSNIKARMES